MRITMTMRLLIGFGVLIMFFLCGTLFALSVQQKVIEKSEVLAQVNLPLALTGADMKLQAIQVQQWLTDVSATHDPGGYEDAQVAYDNFKKGIKVFEDTYAKTGNTEGLAKLEPLRAGIEALYSSGKKMAETYISQGIEQGNVLMEDFDNSSAALAASLDPFIEAQHVAAEQGGADVQNELLFLRLVQIIALGLCLFVGVVSFLLVTRSVKLQLGAEPETVAQAAAEIAKGNFNFKEVALGKAIGVYGAILQMRDQLQKNFKDITARSQEAQEQTRIAQEAEVRANKALEEAEKAKREGVLHATSLLGEIVKNLNVTSTTLHDYIEKIVAGASDQADRVAASSEAMGEMRATVQDIAQSASSAAQVADAARERALAGVGAVKDVITQVDAARTQAQDLKVDMTELGKQTDSISQVLGVINDIADQTNLLALNAAIEAARAGEAGRGFAVVADEVRKLAEKTVIATKEVDAALEQLHAGTERSIVAVDGTVEMIVKATEKTTLSGEALDAIVSLVNDTAGQVSSIASAAEEQAVASEQIDDSLNDMSSITNTALSTMSNASSAMEDLRNEVEGVNKLIRDMESEV